MVAELKACFDGFECIWPTAVEVIYRGKRFNLGPGAFTARAVLGLTVSDQPAAAMLGGWAFHGAFLSCRWGGQACAGSKLDTKQVTARPFLIPKGKVKANKTKKAKQGEAGAASASAATSESQLCGEPNVKSGATVHVAVRPLSDGGTNSKWALRFGRATHQGRRNSWPT